MQLIDYTNPKWKINRLKLKFNTYIKNPIIEDRHYSKSNIIVIEASLQQWKFHGKSFMHTNLTLILYTNPHKIQVLILLVIDIRNSSHFLEPFT